MLNPSPGLITRGSKPLTIRFIKGVHKQCLIYLVCLAHMQRGISYMPWTVILFTYFAVWTVYWLNF